MFPSLTLPNVRIGLSFRVLDVVAVSFFTWTLIRLARTAHRRARTTRLNGPPSRNHVLGFPEFFSIHDYSPDTYEAWAEEYGAVYQLPSVLGTTRIILCDPKAIAHFYAKETTTYILTPLGKFLTGAVAGRGSLLTTHGDVHKRLRKSLTPAFSVAAIRKLLPIFYDSAYKTKTAWDEILQDSPDGATIEAQEWMSHISLDTIGIAGFSHDFASLKGVKSVVATAFQEMSNTKPSPLFKYLFLLAHIFPGILKLPNPRTKLSKMLHDSMNAISTQLFANTKKEKEDGLVEGEQDKSIIGLLIKAESTDSALHMTPEEVVAQMRVLLFAGYDTTSISLTWALIELCRDQDAQDKLREELSQIDGDPTWEQLTNGLPYLDAVVHETLRLHALLGESSRMATEDDIIPLSGPVVTLFSPTPVTHVSIPRGTIVTAPIASVNRSKVLWGPDAKQFKPSRWIHEDGIPQQAKEIQGHKHLLTFADGPRTCLGKGFAITEFKVHTSSCSCGA
ncbi:cytochrome P450 [Boletus reticuloceps]|uniref:Cytochrome P450 n=1 Tax=Boletus reticuloceps TaxID=495285 RepID=A0A8I3A830_9AGAM|nr:cytochrome P450 [Boletus reticuloceps]